MSDYDKLTAFHYAAYRPPLHAPILDQCLEGHYDIGLDFGCGTGQSSLALAEYCDKVIGIDNSKDMLQRAIFHPRVEYRHAPAGGLQFPDNWFEVTTLAGSLYYAKSQRLLDELLRVNRQGARIVVYDFDLQTAAVACLFGVNVEEVPPSGYDHTIGFEGLRQDGLKLLAANEETAHLEMTYGELCHLLLSERRLLLPLIEQFGTERLYDGMLEMITEKFKKHSRLQVPATRYSKVYLVG